MNAQDRLSFSRRTLLTGAAATAAFGLSPQLALAKAPMAPVQAPAYYRFKVGSFEATVISDGPLLTGPPSAEMFTGLSKDEMTRTLTDNYLATDNVALDQNALVINTGDSVVLFDTGTGAAKMMGPAAGKLLRNLRAARITPEQVDAVVITHAHPDHCWALVGRGNKPNFPNAKIYMAQADFDFWTDEGKYSIAPLKPMIEGTRKQLLPVRDRITFIKEGQEFIPGIQAMATPGHTVGHLSFMITSQGKTLLNLADVAHHHIISLEQPKLKFSFDTDGDQAVATRARVFDMLASSRIPMVAYHFPFPGIGYVGKHGDAYRYFPEPMRTVL